MIVSSLVLCIVTSMSLMRRISVMLNMSNNSCVRGYVSLLRRFICIDPPDYTYITPSTSPVAHRN